MRTRTPSRYDSIHALTTSSALIDSPVRIPTICAHLLEGAIAASVITPQRFWYLCIKSRSSE